MLTEEKSTDTNYPSTPVRERKRYREIRQKLNLPTYHQLLIVSPEVGK